MNKLVAVAAVVGLFLVPMTLRAQEAQEVQKPGEVRVNASTVPTVADLTAQLAKPGVREVEVKGLTADQVSTALLSTDPKTNVLVQLKDQLKPGQEVEFRTADGQRFRVENEQGELRVRVRDSAVKDPAALARFFAQAGFTRVEIRGVDAAGNRVRIEVRNGVITKNEVGEGRGAEHGVRGKDRAEFEPAKREDRREDRRADRPEKVERVARPDKPERVERVERSGRH